MQVQLHLNHEKAWQEKHVRLLPGLRFFAEGCSCCVQEGGIRQTLYPLNRSELNLVNGGDAYFAMCLAVKDQHEDIREWILYHNSIGAGRFYVFDNNSTIPMLPVIADMVRCTPAHRHAQGTTRMYLRAFCPCASCQ